VGSKDSAGAADDLGGRVVGMADLVEYQKGSAVSRTLINKKVGTVTLFAFDKGEGLSEHTTPYDALVHVLDGEVEITIAGEPMTVRAGEMLIMPADKPHALRALSPFKMALVMIRA
jgi:quercetin dioxygenase-like cupin family protein